MKDPTDRRNRRRRVWWLGAAALSLAVLALLAYLQPRAPTHIDLLTGPEDSAYHELGLTIAAELEDAGIHARVVTTTGALDNLDRLARSTVPAVAFAQSSIEREVEDPAALAELLSLGSFAYEPFWIFVRLDADGSGLRGLAGTKLALGPKGSGSRAIGELLLEANGLLGEAGPVCVDLGDTDAARALLEGEVDAVFLVGSSRSEAVAELLAADGIRPKSLSRASSYAAVFPYLATFEILPGVIDLAHNRPAERIETLAATTNLVIAEGMHGALLEALLDAARGVRTRPRIESPPGVFPSMQHVSLPLDPRARRYYEHGPSPWGRLLPYWVAALVQQLVVVVLPALAVLIALLKLFPSLRVLRFNMACLRLTRRLLTVERAAIADDAAMASLDADLDTIDHDSAALRVPASKGMAYLELRQTLHDTRERLAARRAAP